MLLLGGFCFLKEVLKDSMKIKNKLHIRFSKVTFAVLSKKNHTI